MSNFTSSKCGDTSYEHIYTALRIHFKEVVNVITRVRFYDKILLVSLCRIELGLDLVLGHISVTLPLSCPWITLHMMHCFVVMFYKINDLDVLSVKISSQFSVKLHCRHHNAYLIELRVYYRSDVPRKFHPKDHNIQCLFFLFWKIFIFLFCEKLTVLLPFFCLIQCHCLWFRLFYCCRSIQKRHG